MMNSKITLITLMILSFMCMSLVFVQAADMDSKQPPSFNELDVNSDNQITAEEFSAFRRERVQDQSEERKMIKNVNRISAFASFDKNKDGVISEEEFAAHPRYANSTNKKADKKMMKQQKQSKANKSNSSKGGKSSKSSNSSKGGKSK